MALCLPAIGLVPARFQPVLLLAGLGCLLGWCALACSPGSRAGRRVFLSLSSLLLCLSLVEGWCLSQDRVRLVSSSFYTRVGGPLGYQPRAGATSTVKKSSGSELIYEVAYSFDEHGLRTHPRWRAEGASNVLFFGDSYTLGEGVQAADSLPAQLERLGQGALACHNFGFHGYGPHHMLARLQDSADPALIRPGATPLVVHISLFPDQVKRLMGRVLWDFQGPHYRLEDGQLVHQGPFHPPWRARLMTAWSRFVLVKRLYAARPHQPSASDLDTYVATLQASQRLVQQRYPEAEFLVIVWVRRFPGSEVVERLRQVGINAISVADILPQRDQKEFYIHPQDKHPNAKAYAALAAYLWEYLRSLSEPTLPKAPPAPPAPPSSGRGV
jgi:hypothetical protein